jgi:hypothetical protein
MSPLIQTYEACRLGIQTHIGRSPFLYQLLHRARNAPRSWNLVGTETELCIEAPSGSGNSFFVNGFLMINPGIRVAHHHHVAAQLKRSVALQVPTVVILRHPIDCVLSRSYNAPWMAGPVFKQWIRFFATAERLKASLLLLPFETVTRDPGGAVERINARFARCFETDFPEPARVFSQMDEASSRARGLPPGGRSPNRPDPSKADRQSRIRPLVESHPLARAAVPLYQRMRRSAQ